MRHKISVRSSGRFLSSSRNESFISVTGVTFAFDCAVSDYYKYQNKNKSPTAKSGVYGEWYGFMLSDGGSVSSCVVMMKQHCLLTNLAIFSAIRHRPII